MEGYTVTVPSLAGCISEGDTFEQAKENISDAIKLYLEDLDADGKEIPRIYSNFLKRTDFMLIDKVEVI